MDLSQQYQVILPHLHKSLQEFATQLHQIFPDGQFKHQHNVKDLPRSLEKCRQKNYTDITQLSDLIRGRLFFPTSSSYQDTLQTLIKNLGSLIHKIEWKRDQDYGLEYRGILHIDLDVNGVKFELQVMPLSFEPFVELQHRIYQAFRDHEAMGVDTRHKLIEMHNRIFNQLEKRYL